MELKKAPDTSQIQAAGAAALNGHAAETGDPPTQEPAKRRRGRKPGTRFPNGYKKSAKPAEDHSEERYADPTDEQDAAGIFSAIPSLTGAFEKIIDVGFNRILARRAGEHWAIDAEDTRTLAEPLAEIFEELMPDINDKWAIRISTLSFILGPRIYREYTMQKEKRKAKNADKKTAEKPTDPPKHSTDPGATRTRQDDIMQTASQSIGEIPCDRRS